MYSTDIANVFGTFIAFIFAFDEKIRNHVRLFVQTDSNEFTTHSIRED